MRGIVESYKRRAIFDYYRKNADILVLQETHSTPQCEKIWRNEWGGEVYFSHGTSSARGVAIFVTEKYVKSISNIFRDVEGRILIVDVQENGVLTTVVSIYAPNKDTPSFFQLIEDQLKLRQENKIVLGDFNLTMDVEVDRQNTYCNNNKSRDKLVDIMSQFCLKDIWREQNGDKREFSWHSRGNINKASRIDFALVTGGLDQKVKCVMYLTGIYTDHRALYMVVEPTFNERGSGYWKFNVSLLGSIEFISYMNSEIDITLQATSTRNAWDRWELLKKRVKKSSVDYSRSKSKENNLLISTLSEKVNEYEREMPLTERDCELYCETKKELEDKLLERIKGVMFRSKAKWHEQGEKNSKYFFSLEKSKYNAKTCFKIVREGGEEIDDPKHILDVQREFYQELYQFQSS